MHSLTSKLFSIILAAVVTLPVAIQNADAVPTRYFVPNYGKPAAKKPTKKKVARKPTRRANYQRRVPMQSAVRNFGGSDYLHQVGGNSRWPEGKTIRVYVAPSKRSSYRSIVSDAMNKWTRASGGAFNWKLVGSPSNADYTISWTATQRELSSGTEAGLTTTDTIVNPYTGSETIDHAHTRILTRYNGRQLSDREIAETTLHEIGHALGLEGHSSNPRDIMYYAATQGQGGLTARDMNTIQRLYNRRG